MIYKSYQNFYMKSDIFCNQVPVINKTESLFDRNPENPRELLHEINHDAQKLLESEPYICTVKTDGTCGIIFKISDSEIWLMRRQDIKVNSEKHKTIINNGQLTIINGVQCYLTNIKRDNKINASLYIFYLDKYGLPAIENNHIIGFTPIINNFGEDKYLITAIDGINGTSNMALYTTCFEGNIDILVKKISVEKILGEKKLLTVEIMGSKIANHYGFINDQHFVNPHGSIIFPHNEIPKLDYESLMKWIQNEINNRWADVEGMVIHFPNSARRFKFHQGYFGFQNRWHKKKESGLRFFF